MEIVFFVGGRVFRIVECTVRSGTEKIVRQKVNIGRVYLICVCNNWNWNWSSFKSEELFSSNAVKTMTTTHETGRFAPLLHIQIVKTANPTATTVTLQGSYPKRYSTAFV